MANRSILIKWAHSRYIAGREDAIRVKIWVDCQEGLLDDGIFAYRQLTRSPNTGQKAGFFSHVCSPTDMEEYGYEAPIPSQRPEWYRLNYVDVLLRSREEVEAFIDDVKSDIRSLKLTLDRIETLEASTQTEYGSGCVDDSDSSSSSSQAAEASVPQFICVTDQMSPQTSASIGYGTDWSGTGPWEVTLNPDTSSAMLLLRNFDFSALAADAIITGIEVEVLLSDGSSASLTDENTPELCLMRLYHPDSGPVGDDKADPNVSAPDGELLSYGDESDLWGYSWAASDIKRAEFGLALAFYLPFNDGSWSSGGCQTSYSPADNNPAKIVISSINMQVYYRCDDEESSSSSG